MKPEARILLSSCNPDICLCIGLILRGAGVDGAVSGRSCRELCLDFEVRGFRGETRFAAGYCTCGLPEPLAWRPEWDRYAEALDEGWLWLKHYKPLRERWSVQGDQ